MSRPIPADEVRCQAAVSLDRWPSRETNPEPNPANEGRCRNRGLHCYGRGWCAVHGGMRASNPASVTIHPTAKATS